MAEREDAAIAPDEVERERQQRVAEILAEQRDHIGRHVEGAVAARRRLSSGTSTATAASTQQERRAAPVERAEEPGADHASTARPFSANRPRGRFWMNRMMSDQHHDLAEHRAGHRARGTC